jgi:fructuronate reductase
MTLIGPANATADPTPAEATDLQRLCERTLPQASPMVLRPNYDRARTTIGTVHFGPGAFHRAHQAFYFDRLLERDGSRAICEVSLKTSSVHDALAPQDGLYTLIELDEAPTVRVIGAIRELLVATQNPAAVSRRLAAPGTSLVTITVTEKGYCLDGTGELDFDHADVVHDLRNPETPRSLIGWLARGLQLRHERGLAPYLVLSCDNLADNGLKLQRAVLAFAARRDRSLADWIEERTRFPPTMVDSITPATDTALRCDVARTLGLEDAWPVRRERFVQWVIGETDSSTQPDWASVGVTLSRDVSAHEQAKLRLLNGAHSTLAYLGLLAGIETVAEAMAEPALRFFIERLMIEDIQPTLTVSRGEALVAYRQSILRRFENPAMRHQLAQIAWDGSQKLPIRIFGTIADAICAHRPLARLALPVAAWVHYIRLQAAAATPIVDPLCEQLAACGQRATGNATYDLPMFLNLPGVFPANLVRNSEFVQALGGAYDLIASRGPLVAATLAVSRRIC